MPPVTPTPSNPVQWIPYTPKQPVIEMKLCYHNGTPDSDLPLRDVLYRSTEPNYETATYNFCAKCLRTHLQAAINDRLSHILFATQCKRESSPYFGRFFIVGYYEIGWTATVEDSTEIRTAIRAKTLSFARIEDAYEVTREVWHQLCPEGKELTSVRQLKQRIPRSLADEIVEHLDAHDAAADYLREVARLKSKYNPYDKIPSGRIFIINVGANTEHRQQSPLFDDDSFEFVPITASSDDGYTFGDLRQFYAPDTLLTERFSSLNISPATKVHNDPEFATFTYGDSPVVKPGLRPMTKGDFLFFLVRLVPFRNQQYHHDEGIFALIGFLEIEEIIPLPFDATIDPILTSPAFNRNAHVIRWLNDHVSYDDGYVVYKGSTNSRRFRKAVKFDRAFVEDIPFLTAAGAPWNWGTDTELSVINWHTRFARQHIDPSADSERTARFWNRIWKSQQWSGTAADSSCLRPVHKSVQRR